MWTPGRSSCLFATAVGLLLGLQAGAARADVAGSKDHELVGRYEGSEIVGYQESEYDEVKIVEGPFDPAASGQTGAGFKSVEGRSVLIYYKLPEGRSSLEVLRNYEASLEENGFTIVFTCDTSDGSCFISGAPDAAYFLGSAVGDPLSLPKLIDDYVHNWFEQRGRYLLASLEGPEGTIYASLFFGESSRGGVAVVRVVETTEMETDKIDFLDAEQMQQAITETGRAVLYGIHFDFDDDTLRPDSEPTLDEIAKLLEDDPDLRLTIVGHTDNQGTSEYNMDLSSRRAESVVEALVSDYGIDEERLSSSGAGFTAPVAPNDTEEGRALNRRVELVAQ
jgi:outer membrane protein OmpA-like peptidoglycan-associated protein